MMAGLVLASQSPRRREILERAGFPFIVRVSNVPEVPRAGESPVEYVRRLALSKASTVPRSAEEIVLGADTTVVVDDRILEKPLDADDAKQMLTSLSGRNHTVVTGICLLFGDNDAVVDHEVTTVHFAQMTQAEIHAYVASGEPMDKAGAYGIQGLASKWIDQIEGDYLNVVGLPVALVYRHLKQRGLTASVL